MNKARTMLLAGFGSKEAVRLLLEEEGLFEKDGQNGEQTDVKPKSPAEMLRAGYAKQDK
jgi:hypothetical protein